MENGEWKIGSLKFDKLNSKMGNGTVKIDMYKISQVSSASQN